MRSTTLARRPLTTAGALTMGRYVRLFTSQRRTEEERLLWTRDIRFANRVADAIPGARLLELDAGSCVVGPAAVMLDQVVARIARDAREPEYGIVAVDPAVPEAERYLRAYSAAVQLSGIADRIGMAQTTQTAQTKVLDHFFVLRNRHGVHFQPIVELATGHVHEYECLFRPDMPTLPTSISAIVQAAIDTERSVELDSYIVGHILARAAELAREREIAGAEPLRLAINLTPASLLAGEFEAEALVGRVRAAGFQPSQVTLECTEQQAVPDMGPLRRQVKLLRRLGFGFAVDDAGAGYASFTLIAALRPTLIKIDRQIVNGVSTDDAKQALVESFVSFGRRIGARLVAEGIERRRDLATLGGLGVELGQGYLLGRPAETPAPPRSLEPRTTTARAATAAAVGALPRRRQVRTARSTPD
jgi:EAL domain-containing protein (putative c-di-GMP-specific phosphodiesterase class I)